MAVTPDLGLNVQVSDTSEWAEWLGTISRISEVCADVADALKQDIGRLPRIIQANCGDYDDDGDPGDEQKEEQQGGSYVVVKQKPQHYPLRGCE